MTHDRSVLLLVAAALLLGTVASRAADDKKLKKPGLDLRAAPRFAFSPASIFFTAELKGGDDVEEYYCPRVEWDWDDGGKSVQEGDCAPFEPGKSKIERRFTATHEYRTSGGYRVSVKLLKSDKAIAKADVSVTVRPGLTEGYPRP